MRQTEGNLRYSGSRLTLCHRLIGFRKWNLPGIFRILCASLLLVPGMLITPVATGGDWPTYGHDAQRTGNAAGEAVINATSVPYLRLKWSAAVDGKVTGQPLFVHAALVQGQTRDVVVVVTSSNSVYALAADTGALLWHSVFGAPSGTGSVPGGFGISGAPVIDKATGRIYTVTDDGFLRTLALADGSETRAPLQVITDHPATNSVWGGLNLAGNDLYIATGSNGADVPPWWGRIVHVDVGGTAPAVVNVFKVVPGIAVPNGGGGIWGYGGVTMDTTGRVFAATSADDVLNSNLAEGYTPYAGRMVALDAGLALLGTYEPPHPTPCPGDAGVCDMDFGATPVIFQPTGCPTLVAAVNKDGHLYKLNADDLAAGSTASLQALMLNIAFDGPGSGGLTGVPAFWPGGNMLFVTDGRDPALGSVSGIQAGVIGLSVGAAPACDLQVAWSIDWWSAGLTGAEQPPSPPTVAGGVVFVGSGVNGSVHAYDAATGSELWNSGTAISGATFVAPIVADGTLYAGSWNGFGATDGGTIYAFAPGAAPSTNRKLLGDDALESYVDSNAAGSAEAFQVTANDSGTLDELSVYIDSSSTLPGGTTLQVGLYSDAGGHPGTLLAQASNSTALQPGAWNTIPVTGTPVTAGTPYWIAILPPQGDTGVLHFRDNSSGGCLSENSGQTDLTTLPSNWVSGAVWSTCPLSAYGSALVSASTITVDATPRSVIAGQPVTFTATVTGDAPAGTVQFQVNGVNFGSPVTLVNGVATITTSELTVTGTDSITAVYFGDQNNGGSATTTAFSEIVTLGHDGDINGDGVVDTADVLLATQMALGVLTPDTSQLAHGDIAPLVNGTPSPDQVLDLADVLVISRKALGQF
jgi:outer membrane protein assembly factor BamB